MISGKVEDTADEPVDEPDDEDVEEPESAPERIGFKRKPVPINTDAAAKAILNERGSLDGGRAYGALR